jgi:hypothetical protein
MSAQSWKAHLMHLGLFQGAQPLVCVLTSWLLYWSLCLDEGIRASEDLKQIRLRPTLSSASLGPHTHGPVTQDASALRCTRLENEVNRSSVTVVPHRTFIRRLTD